MHRACQLRTAAVHFLGINGVPTVILSRKVEQQDSCTSKGRPLAFLTATSLCPLVWLYIIFMLVIFIRQV